MQISDVTKVTVLLDEVYYIFKENLENPLKPQQHFHLLHEENYIHISASVFHSRL